MPIKVSGGEMGKIGARQNGSLKAVSTAPSINKTPVGNSTPPLPYPVTQDLGSSVGVVPNVRFNGDPAYVLDKSTQPKCTGDAPGSCGGVKCGTTSGEVKPVRGSSNMRISGKPVIRQGDPCTMNSGNCPGIYITTQVPHISGSVSSSASSASSSPPIQPETAAEQSFLSSAGAAAAPMGEYANTGKLMVLAGVAAGAGVSPHPAAGFVPGTKGA